MAKHNFEGGLGSALYDSPRSGCPVTKMTGDVEAQLIALTRSKPPEGHDQWILRLLANRLVELEVGESISHVTVGETLKKRTQTLASKIVVYAQTWDTFCS